MPDGGKHDKHGKRRGGNRRHEEPVACQELEAWEELLFQFPQHEYADAQDRKGLVGEAVAGEKRPRLGEYLPDYEGTYYRLVDGQNEAEKEAMFNESRYL